LLYFEPTVPREDAEGLNAKINRATAPLQIPGPSPHMIRGPKVTGETSTTSHHFRRLLQHHDLMRVRIHAGMRLASPPARSNTVFLSSPKWFGAPPELTARAATVLIEVAARGS